MKQRIITAASLALLVLTLTTPVMPHEPAPDGCGAFTRDVNHELSVMRSPAISMTADAGVAGQPTLVLDKHYALNLLAQDRMRFAVKPARKSRTDAPRGGAFQFEVPVTGRYRISITSRHWVDVVDGATAIESADHFGPGCNVLHKIVEFDLSAGRKLTLQLSGQDDGIVGLAITAAPYAPKQKT